jgi:hypothetical protein
MTFMFNMIFKLTTELAGNDCEYKEAMLTIDSDVNYKHSNGMLTLFPPCSYVSATPVSLKSHRY